MSDTLPSCNQLVFPSIFVVVVVFLIVLSVEMKQEGAPPSATIIFSICDLTEGPQGGPSTLKWQ